jgi:hypothetical protein
VLLDHVEPMFFLTLVTHLPACINLNTYYLSALYLDTLGFEICVWVELLSPAVMIYRIIFPYFTMLSWLVDYCESCGLPSIMS